MAFFSLIRYSNVIHSQSRALCFIAFIFRFFHMQVYEFTQRNAWDFLQTCIVRVLLHGMTIIWCTCFFQHISYRDNTHQVFHSKNVPQQILIELHMVYLHRVRFFQLFFNVEHLCFCCSGSHHLYNFTKDCWAVFFHWNIPCINCVHDLKADLKDVLLAIWNFPNDFFPSNFC